jgi:hypothetical protein
VDPISIIRLVQGEPGTYRLEGATTLKVSRKLEDFEKRIEYAYGLLDRLQTSKESQRAATA